MIPEEVETWVKQKKCLGYKIWMQDLNLAHLHTCLTSF